MALHNSGISVWIPVITRSVGSWSYYPFTNFPRCVMSFRSHAHAFSLYNTTRWSFSHLPWSHLFKTLFAYGRCFQSYFELPGALKVISYVALKILWWINTFQMNCMLFSFCYLWPQSISHKLLIMTILLTCAHIRDLASRALSDHKP